MRRGLPCRWGSTTQANSSQDCFAQPCPPLPLSPGSIPSFPHKHPCPDCRPASASAFEGQRRLQAVRPALSASQSDSSVPVGVAVVWIQNPLEEKQVQHLLATPSANLGCGLGIYLPTYLGGDPHLSPHIPHSTEVSPGGKEGGHSGDREKFWLRSLEYLTLPGL